MICLDIPENSLEEKTIEDLPYNWFVNPARDALQIIGNTFIRNNTSLALKLPSAVMPEESNYLLNPQYTMFQSNKSVVQKNHSH